MKLRRSIDIEYAMKCVSYNQETGEFIALKDIGMRKAGSVLSKLNHKGYVVITIQKKRVFAHRLAFAFVHGEVPEFIDHINGDKLDNRIINLRKADKVTNAWNMCMKKYSKSPFKGISWHKKTNKWQVQIRMNGPLKALGYYTNPVEAAYIYDMASIRLHGEYGKRNFLPLVH